MFFSIDTITIEDSKIERCPNGLGLAGTNQVDSLVDNSDVTIINSSFIDNTNQAIYLEENGVTLFLKNVTISGSANGIIHPDPVVYGGGSTNGLTIENSTLLGTGAAGSKGVFIREIGRAHV